MSTQTFVQEQVLPTGEDEIFVKVNCRWTYRWSGGPISVGDRVLCPPGRSEDCWVGTVTQVPSRMSYPGPFKSIIRREPRKL